MPLFVAFLRGINVGRHTVKKEVLRQMFVALGFQNVETYRQSGNVVFRADSADVEALRGKITEALSTTLGYKVAVLFRTMKQLKCILEMDIFKGQKHEGVSFLVTFLPTPANFPLQVPLTIPKSTAQIIATNDSEVFSITHGGGEGALPNPFIESKLRILATTRNINVIREIVAKFGG